MTTPKQQKTFRVNLRDAHHIICYKVPAPSRDQIKNRHVRLYQTSSLEDLATYMQRYVQAGQKIALAVPDDGSGDDAQKVVDDQIEAAVVGERTLIKTADRVGHHIIANMQMRSHLPWVTDLDKPLKGVPAFIVYSGYSLDKNIILIQECKKQGVVFTSNTPVKALLKYGVQPDVLVCLENREVHDKTEGVRPLVFACDMTAHENNWKVDAEYTLRMYQPDLAYIQYCVAAGSIPVANGGFVGSTAVNLAYLWGADPIVLIGFDLALTDGKPCTQHIGSDTTVRFDEMFAYFESSHPCNGKSFWTEIEAYGGKGTLKTTYERLGYKKYLEKFATLVEGVELINATEGGSRIAGWQEKTLAETLKTATWHAKVHGHTETLRTQLEAIDTQNNAEKGTAMLRSIKAACEQIVKLGGKYTVESEMRMRQLARDEPLIYTLLAPRFITLKYERPTDLERLKKIRELTVECAAKVLKTMEEA